MIIVVEELCRTHPNKNLALLNFWIYIFIPARAGRDINNTTGVHSVSSINNYSLFKMSK